MPKYSFVITEGFEKSHVLFEEAMKKGNHGPSMNPSDYYSKSDADSKFATKQELQSKTTSVSVITDLSEYSHTPGDGEPVYNANYDLLPGGYYMLGSVGSSDSVLPADTTLSLHFPENAESVVNQYMGRFTVVGDNMTVELNDGVHFPDNTPALEDGHTYEFNILGDTCLLTDITYTVPDASESDDDES